MNSDVQIQKALDSLKDFQKATVDYVYDGFYKHGKSRMLVADEVGLGKTIVARGIVARAYKKFLKAKKRTGKKEFHVVYICSNQALASQNIQKLNLMESDEVVKKSIGRLVFLARKERKSDHDFRISTLTPGTSFHVTYSTGYWKERALIFALLTRYSPFSKKNRWNGLSHILQAGLSRSRWLEKIKKYDRNRYDLIRHRLFREFREALLNTVIDAETFPRSINAFNNIQGVSLWHGLIRLASEINGRNIHKYNFQYEIIRRLRHILTKLCLQYLDADMFILDEFQRFKDLIDDSNTSPAAQLAQRVFDIKKAKILLLSATPFKPYTNSFDIEHGEDHFNEFTTVLKFLMKKHPAIFWDDYEKTRKEFFHLLRRPEEAIKEISKAKRITKDLENLYSEVMTRTERTNASNYHNSLIKDKIRDKISSSRADVRDFIETDKIVQAINKKLKAPIQKPVEYCKSTPYPLSFMENYHLKNKLKVFRDNGEIKSSLLKNRNMWLNLNDINKYKPLGPSDSPHHLPNGKLRLLMNESLYPDGWKLLWVTPTAPYYELTGAFEGTEYYSKTLVFSSWVMVPRMISTMLSYEVERLTIGNKKTIKEQEKPKVRKYFNPKKKKRHPVPQLVFSTDRQKKMCNNMTNFCLLYPSLTLIELYKPVDNLIHKKSLKTIRSELRIRIRSLIANAKLERYCNPNGEPSKWYWAAPLLLDKHNDKCSDTIEYWLKQLGFVEGATVDAERRETREDSKSKVEHLDELYSCFSEPENIGLGKMPDDLEDVLVNMILGSPSICAYRSLGNYFSDIFEKLNESFDLAHGFLTLFNKPESIAVVRLFTNGNIYWQRVLEYSVSGNMQAMLDEYMYLLYDCETYRDIKKLCSHITDVMSIRTSSIKVDDLNTFINRNSRGMRCHFAMDFGSQNIETASGIGRMVNLRQTFNSPFRPFVLASTSIGQEGLDFHYYCRRVIHWNLPSNPVDIEQREGRINRYKGLCIRHNIASKYISQIKKLHSNIWDNIFGIAEVKEKSNGTCELVPYWHVNDTDKIKIERIVPLYAYSKDTEKYRNLLKILSCYRLTFGQPRQEELVEALLMENLSGNDLGILRDALTINLSPFLKRPVK